VASVAASSYTYDNLNRLTSATINGSRIEYQYDSAGNLIRVLTPYRIAVGKSGSGAGMVADDLGKVDCGDDCDGVYDLSSSVTLTAAASVNSSFGGWSGDCTGTNPQCVVSVDGVKNVSAAFVSLGADLGMSVSDGLSSVAPGLSVTYSIVASNAGPGTPSGVSVTDTFPGIASCTWTSSAAGGATGSAGSGSGSISESLTLPPGSSMTYTATCDVDPSATGTLSDTANIASALNDPVSTNNSATDMTTLSPAADLWISKSASAPDIGSGGYIVYTLTAGSHGPSTASSISVEDPIPAGTSLVSINAAAWTCQNNSGTVTCTRSGFAVDQQEQIQITLHMPQAGGDVINDAAVSAATAEYAPGDETDSATVHVHAPPKIVDVGSVSSVEGGSIVAGTSTLESITQIYLHASDDLNDPAGDSALGDVTNPASYRLFRAGPGGSFAASSCAATSDVPITAALYEVAGARTISLTLDSGRQLSAGKYRLMVCGGTGTSDIEDIYGSALDGDGDGVGGDDYSIAFEVLATNLLTNPNIDQDLAGWTIASETTGDIVRDPAVDAGEAPTSGSAELENLIGTGSTLEISQCIPVAGGQAYQIGGRFRTESLGPTYPVVHARVESFDAVSCAGSSLAIQDVEVLAGDNGGLWLADLQPGQISPVGALSARVSYLAVGDETSAKAWLDDLRFFSANLFEDGFESGDGSAWTTAVGFP